MIGDENLYDYCEKFSTPESDLLKELDRETHLKTMAPRMLSGHLQGRFLSMVSFWLQPKAVLEIGTFTGYATLCLAEGLAPEGKVHTIDITDEYQHISEKYFKRSAYDDKIIRHLGDALDIIPTMSGPFDLVFIDAKKQHYSAYYDLVIEKLRPGGVVLADNVLWSGKVLQEKKDKSTRAIHAFNEKVSQDDRVNHMILPLRDGIHMITKK